VTSADPAAPSGSGARPAEQEPQATPQAFDKTMFMAAPTSFLQAFCESDEPKQDSAAANALAPVADAKDPLASRRPRKGVMLLLSELASLSASEDSAGAQRKWWKVAAVASVLGALALTAYLWGGSERDLKDAFAKGQYVRAAALAGRLLEKHPGDVELKARATEASLKANVPAWLAHVRGRDFEGATRVLTDMSELAKRDSDLRSLIDELEWLGNLERLVSARGGPDAPIRIYADEDSIARLVGRWNDDTGEHQRALDRIASHVPQFGDWYGEALTHLRRLQSEATVYLPVIERLKASIATELARDNADALEPLLKETADKYPGLGGLSSVSQDLARYIEIRRDADAHKTGRLFAQLRNAPFATPPFQQNIRELMESGQLPPADLLRQYDVATQAWQDGNTSMAFAELEKMSTGPWGEDAVKELERRQGVAARFDAIQRSRNESDFVDELVAFLGSLDAKEDVHFVRAAAADLNLQKDRVAELARDAMNRARKSWEEYRSNGAIDASQRIETSISDQFRARAGLLAEADSSARQGLLIYAQIDATRAAQWGSLRDEIEAEAREQRSKLRDLGRVIDPGLLAAKLALLGDQP
jgi:hypothetical protein